MLVTGSHLLLNEFHSKNSSVTVFIPTAGECNKLSGQAQEHGSHNGAMAKKKLFYHSDHAGQQLKY